LRTYCLSQCPRAFLISPTSSSTRKITSNEHRKPPAFAHRVVSSSSYREPNRTADQHGYTCGLSKTVSQVNSTGGNRNPFCNEDRIDAYFKAARFARLCLKPCLTSRSPVRSAFHRFAFPSAYAGTETPCQHFKSAD